MSLGCLCALGSVEVHGLEGDQRPPAVPEDGGRRRRMQDLLEVPACAANATGVDNKAGEHPAEEVSGEVVSQNVVTCSGMLLLCDSSVFSEIQR